MGSFFQELKRRKVLRVAAVYAVVAWLLIQVSSTVLPTFEAPPWVNQTLTLLFILGFPVALVLAWAYEISPEGIKSDNRSFSSNQLQATSAQPINYLILAVVLLVAGIQVVDQFISNDDGDRSVDPLVGTDREIALDLNIGEFEYRPITLLRSDIAISPDGNLLAFTGRRDGQVRLYLTNLSTSENRIIVDSNDQTIYPIAPVFSPDNKHVLYYWFGTNEVRSVPVDGGGSTIITDDANNGNGANWLSNDEIVFTHSESKLLHKVSVNGGEPEPLNIQYEIGDMQSWPDLLPDGETLLYTVTSSAFFSEGRIEAFNLQSREVTQLVQNAYNARYAESGHLVFMRDGNLLASSYDISSGELRGVATNIETGIETQSQGFGKTAYSLSSNGRLVYLQGLDVSTARRQRLVIQDENGIIRDIELPTNANTPNYSPDGSQLALSIFESTGNTHIEVFDFDSQRSNRRTFGPRAYGPVWTPDGERLIYTVRDVEGSSIWWTLASNGGQTEMLFESPNFIWPNSYQANTSKIVYSEAQNFDFSLKIYDIENDEIQHRVLDNNGLSTFGGDLSPDGNWLAYTSATASSSGRTAGRREVYISSFPDFNEPRFLVSNNVNGAVDIQWGPDGDTVFYVDTGESAIYRVPVSLGDTVSIGDAEQVAENVSWIDGRRNYAVSPTTNDIVYPQSMGEQFQFGPQSVTLTVVENWFQKLDRLAPSR